MYELPHALITYLKYYEESEKISITLCILKY